MLIRGGKIHTMGTSGTVTGDILVQDGRITAVVQPTTGEVAGCLLDAQDLVILPGLIDACIQNGPQTVPELLLESQSQGITAGLIWPEEEGPCRIITAHGMTESDIYALDLACSTDMQLKNRIRDLSEAGKRPACLVHDSQTCERILQAVDETDTKVILAKLGGCERMVQAIAQSGCPVILGVFGSGNGSAWEMAVRLDALGASVCLTCGYPNAKLCHLPLCAALCVRSGLDRERALRMVTAAPAVLLGLTEAGAIMPGHRADFAIFDGDPLLLATSHVMTISGGKIIH